MPIAGESLPVTGLSQRSGKKEVRYDPGGSTGIREPFSYLSFTHLSQHNAIPDGDGRIKQEQWAVRVPKMRGETFRRDLLSQGCIDTGLKIAQENDDLLIPVQSFLPGGERYLFEMLDEKKPLMRHERIGGIAVMQENDTEGAAGILASRPSIHTVLYPVSAVSGRYRTREFIVLAGENTTRTEYTEYNLTYTIDLATAYFSARLALERQRIHAMMRKGERVLDMFAGVGPFSIALADQASVVYACDINPAAVLLMQKNIARNRRTNIIPVLADATTLPAILPPLFDRVIMNLPLSGSLFLTCAYQLCCPGGVIHWYVLVSEKGEHIAEIKQLGARNVSERMVRSYSAGRFHTVYDIIKA